ncbi:MAG: hypothetical protein PVH28_11905 [Desulfobacterales bacterium]|jgi:uncharacterized protein YpmB
MFRKMITAWIILLGLILVIALSQGVYFKRQLSTMAFEETQWKEWVKKHPYSRMLK